MSEDTVELCDTRGCENDALPGDYLCATCADAYVTLAEEGSAPISPAVQSRICADDYIRLCDRCGNKNESELHAVSHPAHNLGLIACDACIAHPSGAMLKVIGRKA